MAASDPCKSEIAIAIPPFLNVYKDGRVERLMGSAILPPSFDPTTAVQSKDVVISPENGGLSARLYIPSAKITNNNPSDHQKLPLLVYFHGGGFFVESPFSSFYHTYLNAVVSQSNVVAVSVDYRRAPENPLPAAYDDSWMALKWVASIASNQGGDEEWLKNHADFQRLFFAGDSAGGNITHNMAIRVGSVGLVGIKLVGIVLSHPFFWGEEPIGDERKDMQKKTSVDIMWRFACPAASGCDDPMINPAENPKISSLGCTRVVVFVAEKDILRDRNWLYGETVKKSGWGGKLEIVEAQGEEHVFHLFKPTCENAVKMMEKFASFINQD